jgi:hypothetical protein
MNTRKIGLIIASLAIVGLSQSAQAVYTWTTSAIPSAVADVQGCGADANKAFAWVAIPGYPGKQFSFITTTPSGKQMLDILSNAIIAGKKVELNYYGTSGDTPEYLNQWVLRYGKNNCNHETNRFILVHSVNVVAH